MKILALSLFVLFTFQGCKFPPAASTEELPTKSYPEILSDVSSQKLSLQKEWKTTKDKDEVIAKARQFLFYQFMKEIYPSWKGTHWDYNGTTTEPQKGYIACGYFVTTVLEDLEFNIPRVKWAQQASETMIKALTSKVKIFSNAKMEDVISYLKLDPLQNNIYVVGLDDHTGFVIKEGGNLWFIHSAPYTESGGVDKQNLLDKTAVSKSGYKVFGEVLTDENIKKWLKDVKF